ncbi:unnamed protein product [Blepharisma stoltei]|uniref:Uncharacterized protein n=1 Tax=Blepharisma stoltei TaxID=1481888 RepID=A0AAU9K7G6_9CILI|nr:unnamed protein product [Blepharisma stoltei]
MYILLFNFKYIFYIKYILRQHNRNILRIWILFSRIPFKKVHVSDKNDPFSALNSNMEFAMHQAGFSWVLTS